MTHATGWLIALELGRLLWITPSAQPLGPPQFNALAHVRPTVTATWRW